VQHSGINLELEETMNKELNLIFMVSFFLLIFTQGCATHLRKPAGPPQPAKVRFSNFQAVEMNHVTISPKFASAKANQKALGRIDKVFFSCMHLIFPNLNEAEEPNSGIRTLLIEPNSEEIKFIGEAARFWLGALAGSSAILMKVTYRDKATGETIAEPEFYRRSNAWEGQYSMGATDNLMLDNVTRDICTYTNSNL
jgi:hypothetical protein